MAFLQLLLLAYNLVHWFKRLCLPEEKLRTTVETLRHRLLAEISWLEGIFDFFSPCF